MTRRLRAGIQTLAWERGLVLGGACTIIYLALAPGHIVAADNAEFCTLGAVGGGAHPSGYPLYVLYLRATSWLPGSAAHAASLATALLGGLAVIVIHAATRAWGARPLGASLAAALFAGAPLVLRVHTEADVFALNSLVGATILLLAAPAGPLSGARRTFALGLLAGLGLSNHLTCALLAPIGAFGVVTGIREAQHRAIAGALPLVGLALGLAPYAYLFVAPEAASWAPVRSISDLADTFLRRDYGVTSHLPGMATPPLLPSMAHHALLVGRTWLWIPALAGVVVLVLRCVRGERRAAWRMLAISWLLCGPVFAWRLGAESAGVGAYITGRMQILSALVLAIPIAIAIDAAVARTRLVLSQRATSIAACVAFFALLVAAWPRLSRVHGSAVEDGVHNMFVGMPADAVAIVMSEDECFGGRYLQLVEHVRPDVTLVCSPLLTRTWYRARLSLALPPSAGAAATPADADVVFATGRPLLVDTAQKPVLVAYPSYPVGLLERVVRPGDAVPDVETIVAAQTATFAQFSLGATRPRSDDDFAAVEFRRYASAWNQLARAAERAGNTQEANQLREVARQFAPDP